MDYISASEWIRAVLLETAKAEDLSVEVQTNPPPPEKLCTTNELNKVIRLPEPDLLPDKSLNFLEMIELRSTIRAYSNDKLTKKELSYLLWCTQGVKMLTPKGLTKRNVPSAGSRHAFETYLLIQNVEGFECGIYRFLALGHALLPLSFNETDIAKIYQAFNFDKKVKDGAVVFLWSAVLERMSYKFGKRALRYLLIDAGHICQNLYLAAYSLQLGVCAIGAFDDELLQQGLNLNGREDLVLYTATVGKI